MKIYWKRLIIFVSVFAALGLILCEIEYGIFHNMPTIVEKINKQRRTKELLRRDAERKKIAYEKQQQEKLAKIRTAGVCADAFSLATKVYTGYGQVIELLDIPQKTGSNGPVSTCTAKVKVGDMWLPDKNMVMTYQVLKNNGFIQVLFSTSTHTIK